MMTLPATYHEVIGAEALAFARQWIARMREGDFLNLGCAPLHPDAGRRLLRRLIKHYALHDAASMLQIAEIAAYWDDADIALRELIQEFHNRHQPLPAYLVTYNDRIIAGYAPTRPRGRKKASNFLQDFCLVYLIVELTGKFGLSARRYQYGKRRRESACSIVATAAAEAGLHRGAEAAVQKLWDRFEPIVVRAGLAEIIRN
jgi:hypothetical protein